MEPVNVLQERGNFFKVLDQTDRCQVAVMTIESGGDSGPQDYHDCDEVIYVIQGEAVVKINGEDHMLPQGYLITVPAKSRHRVYNFVNEPLVFLNFFSCALY